MTIEINKNDLANIYTMYGYFINNKQMSNELRQKLKNEFKQTINKIFIKAMNKGELKKCQQ